MSGISAMLIYTSSILMIDHLPGEAAPISLSFTVPSSRDIPVINERFAYAAGESISKYRKRLSRFKESVAFDIYTELKQLKHPVVVCWSGHLETQTHRNAFAEWLKKYGHGVREVSFTA